MPEGPTHSTVPTPGTAVPGRVVAGSEPWQPGAAAPEIASSAGGYVFFKPAEAAFVEAAVARLIPADELGGGAIEADVPLFIDRQLNGDFGNATRWYMQGPWGEPTKTQGYQTRLTPAQFYRAAIQAIDAVSTRMHGQAFAALNGDRQDDFLRVLESGAIALDGVDGQAFFGLLLQNTIEGFFCDPVHGGNKDMIGWKLIGFPGARYEQRFFLKAFNQPFPLPPVGIAGRREWSR
ncbi:MAG: gluconate 2-dehydrogenase subunit 3 family protein [Novosphingobium sp.]|nr:gluconate 2-dehydrogenase subunit 3 family protein [Novosphingobium sp.]